MKNFSLSPGELFTPYLVKKSVLLYCCISKTTLIDCSGWTMCKDIQSKANKCELLYEGG